MKRLLIYSDSGGLYGAEQINDLLAITLSGDGFRVCIAQPMTLGAETVPSSSEQLERYLLPTEDAYNTTSLAPGLIDPSIGAACIRTTKPDFILFADGFPFANLAAKRAAQLAGIPFAVLVHCVNQNWSQTFVQLGNELGSAYEDALEVIAVSEHNLGLLHSHYGLPASKGRVILNGRPQRFFERPPPAVREQARRDLGVAHSAIVCLTIGRFEFVKGYQYLLQALPLLRKLPIWHQLHFVWVGSGTLQDRLNKLGNLLAKDKLTVLAPRQDVLGLYAAADLQIQPSQFEGMPLVVLEAMAQSLPVIATSVSGIPEALGNTGWLLPDTAEEHAISEGLAHAVNHLASSPEQRLALGNAARKRALARHSTPPMLAQWRALIHSLPY